MQRRVLRLVEIWNSIFETISVEFILRKKCSKKTPDLEQCWTDQFPYHCSSDHVKGSNTAHSKKNEQGVPARRSKLYLSISFIGGFASWKRYALVPGKLEIYCSSNGGPLQKKGIFLHADVPSRVGEGRAGASLDIIQKYAQFSNPLSPPPPSPPEVQILFTCTDCFTNSTFLITRHNLLAARNFA